MLKVSIVLISVLISSLWQIVLSIEGYNPDFPFPGPFNYTIRIDERLTTPGDIVEGNRVTLICDIDPPDTLTFWRHDFHINTHKVLRTYPKHGIYAFDKYLTFEKIDKSYEGKYDCVGYPQQHPIAIISNNITLRVNERPKVRTEIFGILDVREFANVTLRLISPSFTPQNVEQFSDISLECDVSPSSVIPLNYTFLLDNKEVYPNNTKGAQLQENTLKLREIELTSAGMYLCKVGVNEGYLTSNFLPINVLEKKYVDEDGTWWGTEAKNREDLIAAVKAHTKLGDEFYADDIREYDSVFFICTIDSNLTQIRKITWIENGRILEINPDIGIQQNDPYLLLYNIPKEVAGDYNCIVETTHNTTINSTTTVLRIKYDFNESTRALECPCPNNTNCPCKGSKVQPQVVMQLKPGINPDGIVVGDKVTFTCNLFPFRVTRIRRIFWYHNGQKLSRSEQVGMLNGNTTLVLPRIQKYYAGAYQCMIDTDLAPYYSKETVVITIHSDTALKVLPTATAKLGLRWPSNRVKEYDDVYFQCEIEPNFKNVYRIDWLRNGQILNVLQWYIFTIYWNTILVVPKIGILSGGNYECQITTKTALTIRSNPVKIIVQRNPTDEPKPKKNLLVIPALEWHPEEIFVNKTAYFKCHYYLYPGTMFVKRVLWYYNGEMLDPDIEDGWYKYINRNLLIPVLRKEYVGEFNCMVETNRGEFWGEFPAKLKKILEERSEEVTLNSTAQTKLVAELQNNPDHVYEDDRVYFWCDVQPNTTDIVTINWYLNDTRVYTLHPEPDLYFIPYSDRIYEVPFAKSRIHAGDYFCEVITFEGTIFKSPPTTLIIKERQRFVYYPPPVIVIPTVQLGDPSLIDSIHENDNIYFTCNVTPNKLTVFQRIYYIDGRRIYQDSRDSITYQDGELHIYNIAKDATGNYSCEVRTKLGRYLSENEVSLKVKPERFT